MSNAQADVRLFRKNFLASANTFLAGISEDDFQDDPTFADVIQVLIDTGAIKPADIVSNFGVDKGTVSRWANGKRAPMQMVRPILLDWLKKVVAERLSEAQKVAKRKIRPPKKTNRTAKRKSMAKTRSTRSRKTVYRSEPDARTG